MSLMDSPPNPRWVHGFVWNMHASPLWLSPNVYARLAVTLFLFLWCEQFFLVDAFFCFDVRFPSTCTRFIFCCCCCCCCCLRKPTCPMLLYLGPLLSANTWHDRPLQICFKPFLGVRVRWGFSADVCMTHSACPSPAWRHPWCRADPWLALVYLAGTSPPWAGPSYILPM